MQSDADRESGGIMKPITVRNLPGIVSDAVMSKAKAEHLSISKAIVALLEEHIGKSKVKVKKKRDLSYMVGTWTEEQAKEFDACLKEQRRIDPEMWK